MITDKTINRISIIAVIILVIGAMIFKAIPEYKESIGSSDNFIFSSSYEDMVEFKINKLNFAVITQKNKVVHLLFFSKESLILYNQEIESKTLDEALTLIVKLLINGKYINNNNYVTLTKYEDISYNKVKKLFQEKLKQNNISINLSEKKSTLEEKATSLNVSSSEKNIITQLDIYSKEIISKYKNSQNEDISIENTKLTEQDVYEYANKVYKKLENYVITNNIGVKDINDTNLPIALIPASQQLNLYPSVRSWYYVQNGKVYAYIEFEVSESKYGFCYSGSIEESKKGEC